MVSKKVGRPKKTAPPAAARQLERSSTRRMSRMDMELLMECMDDDLSPAQLKAMEEAQKEHEKVLTCMKRKQQNNQTNKNQSLDPFKVLFPPGQKQKHVCVFFHILFWVLCSSLSELQFYLPLEIGQAFNVKLLTFTVSFPKVRMKFTTSKRGKRTM